MSLSFKQDPNTEMRTISVLATLREIKLALAEVRETLMLQLQVDNRRARRLGIIYIGDAASLIIDREKYGGCFTPETWDGSKGQILRVMNRYQANEVFIEGRIDFAPNLKTKHDGKGESLDFFAIKITR